MKGLHFELRRKSAGFIRGLHGDCMGLGVRAWDIQVFQAKYGVLLGFFQGFTERDLNRYP